MYSGEQGQNKGEQRTLYLNVMRGVLVPMSGGQKVDSCRLDLTHRPPFGLQRYIESPHPQGIARC